MNYLINSTRIKNTTEQYSLGLISMWQFLQRCSFATEAFEQQQRNWALRIDNANEDVNINQPVEVELPALLLANQPVPEHPLDNQLLPLANQQEIQEPFNEMPDDNTQSQNTCMTCLLVTVRESDVKYMILPCGHAWLCATCMLRIQSSDPVRCPVCRQNNIEFQRIFFS